MFDDVLQQCLTHLDSPLLKTDTLPMEDKMAAGAFGSTRNSGWGSPFKIWIMKFCLPVIWMHFYIDDHGKQNPFLLMIRIMQDR